MIVNFVSSCITIAPHFLHREASVRESESDGDGCARPNPLWSCALVSVVLCVCAWCRFSAPCQINDADGKMYASDPCPSVRQIEFHSDEYEHVACPLHRWLPQPMMKKMMRIPHSCADTILSSRASSGNKCPSILYRFNHAWRVNFCLVNASHDSAWGSDP